MRNRRVVSLLPGATEIVAALALTDRLVGRSHECDHPPEITALPVVTASEIDPILPSRLLDRAVADRVQRALSIYHVDAARLTALRPDVILTQTLCAVCAVGPADLASYVEALQPGLQLIELGASNLAAVFGDMQHVAEACGAPTRGPALITRLQARLAHIAAQVKGIRRPRVACIEWLDPLMAAGNWVPELVAIAGGQAALGAAGAHSGTITPADLIAADPDVIVVAPCSFSIARTRAELPGLARRAGWSTLRAVERGAVYLVDGNRFFNRPGPRLVDSAEILAEILHPERAAYGHRDHDWVRWTP